MSQTSVLESIRSLQRRKGPKCSACLSIGALPADIKKGIESALGDETIAASAITEYLSGHGSKVSPQTMQRHRRGECRGI